jgi:hypothetical protein
MKLRNSNSFIKWQYIYINEETLSEFYFDLQTENQIKSFNQLKNSYPDLCNALFHQVTDESLKLKIPYSGYLGSDSCSEDEMILRKFFNDCSANTSEDTKPITLSKESYPIKVYQLFSIILSSFKGKHGWGEPYGVLELGFNDFEGYVCSNGNIEHEIKITIDETGIKWEWWPNDFSDEG